MASVYLGYTGYQHEMDDFRSGDIYGEIPDKPSLMQVFQPMVQLNMTVIAGILAILMGYSTISGERENETIEILLSYPIYRDEVLNGKFIGGMFNICLALLISFTAATGLAVFLSGVIPTLAQFSRLSLIWLGTVIYMGFFLGLGMFFSTVFRSSRRSLGANIFMLLLFLSTPFIAGLAANQIYQMPDDSSPGVGGPGVAVTRGVSGRPPRYAESTERDEKTRQVRRNRERFKDVVSRMSPATSYSNYVSEMLAQSYDEEDVKPTVGRSLASAGGYLVFLISQIVLIFTFSYAAFMRQDL